jgi:quercetin dioxygenase-like cupin family protein
MLGEAHMDRVLVVLGITALVAIPFAGRAADVPDALSVEWEGKKPCEKLHDDGQIRVARCTFPLGAMHIKHSHPAYLTYVLSGGRAKLEDDKGVREVEVKTGAFLESAATVHELTNIGTTTLQYLVVEKKYPQ